MATQVREDHFQACKLLAPMAWMVSWYQTLELRSPEHCPSFYTLGYQTEPLLLRPTPNPQVCSGTWPLALLSAKVEVKMSGFPGRHPMPSSHAVPSSLCLLSLGERFPQSGTIPPDVTPPALSSLLNEDASVLPPGSGDLHAHLTLFLI